MGGIVHLIIDVQNRYFNPGDLSQAFETSARPENAERQRQHTLYGRQVAQDIDAFAAQCRASGIPNIYVMHGSAPKDPAHEDALYAQRIGEADRIVVKKGFDAFFGTDLKQVLEHYGADAVILSGGVLATCVYETGMRAVQEGYRTIIAKDLVLPDIFDFQNTDFRFSEMEDWGMEICAAATVIQPGMQAEETKDRAVKDEQKPQKIRPTRQK